MNTSPPDSSFFFPIDINRIEAIRFVLRGMYIFIIERTTTEIKNCCLNQFKTDFGIERVALLERIIFTIFKVDVNICCYTILSMNENQS